MVKWSAGAKGAPAFSLRRLALCAARQKFLDFLALWPALLALQAALLAFALFFGGLQPGIFSLVFWLSATLYAAEAFRDASRPKSAIGFFMLPASPVEKFLAAWLLSFIGFPIIYAVLGLLAAGLGFVVYAVGGSGADYNFFNPFARERLQNLMRYSLNGGLARYAAAHGCFFLGSLLFKKRPWLSVIAVIAAAHIIIFIAGAAWFFNAANRGNSSIFLPVRLMESLWAKQSAAAALLALLFWTAAWLKLKRMPA